MEQDQARTGGSVEAVVTARVSTETYEALRSIADQNYRSISSHVRALIEADVAARASRLEEAA